MRISNRAMPYAPKTKQGVHDGCGCKYPAQDLFDILHTFDTALSETVQSTPTAINNCDSAVTVVIRRLH